MKITQASGTRAAICAIALAAASTFPTAVLSEQVSLRSADGTVNLIGEFIDYKEDHYIIRTLLGDLRIAASRVSCEGAACPTFETTAADVQFAGTDTIGLGLMPLLLTGYAAGLDADASIKSAGTNGEIIAEIVGDSGYGDPIGSYSVSSSSSSDAFRSLLDNSAQIGMASRRILPAEARALESAGAGNMIDPNQEHIVAVDSLVVITHPSNPVSSLTIEQLQGIYSGRIKTWKQVGGTDAPIKVVNRAEGTGSRSVFDNAVFGQNARTGAAQVIAEDNNQMAAMVNEDVGAIGFVGFAFQRGAKPVTIVSECGIATEPDAFSAKTEEYPLQRRLYLYNRADNLSDAGRQFIRFAMSEDADGVIAKSGFIDLGVLRRPQEMDGQRARMLLDSKADAYEGGYMRAMLSQMIDYDRLSTTFRFRTGSSKLDERGQVDLERLVDYLERQGASTEILFVGFTDSVGAFDGNLNLSVERASRVIDEVRTIAGDRLSHVTMTATGYGEVAPTACNENEQGRGINRRVEVWLKVPKPS